MNIRDLTKEPVELTVDEQRDIVGGIGWFFAAWAAAEVATVVYDSVPDKLNTTEVSDNVIAGAIKGRSSKRAKGRF